jgi:hypothetical protein
LTVRFGAAAPAASPSIFTLPDNSKGGKSTSSTLAISEFSNCHSMLRLTSCVLPSSYCAITR